MGNRTWILARKVTAATTAEQTQMRIVQKVSTVVYHAANISRERPRHAKSFVSPSEYPTTVCY